MSERKMPAPPVTPENKPFWDAAAQGKLLYKRCEDCGEPHFYPRALCPFCLSDRTAWAESAGRGTIYSFSPMRRGTPVPYAIAYVTLDEGYTMLTNLADCDFDALAIGQRVRVIFKPSEDGSPVPMFTPA